MSSYSSEFLQTLDQRGFIYQVTDAEALDAACQAGPITAYIGFDATAPSLHVGSLVQIMMLRHLQQTGHRPIVLLGGGTTKVGDPSDKDKSRPILSEAQIEANKAGIRRVFNAFLDFGEEGGEGDNGAILVDNDDWLGELGYLEFLREIGPHFTVNRMVALESVKRRLDREQPMTFLEFNYSLLQSFDFLELHRRHGCRLQMGGSDQWGNIVSGADLTRRLSGEAVFGLTTPLITTASGGKMGKTASGAVWLNADPALGAAFTRSPYEYWQFWRNTEDADVGRFLRLFTELPLPEIARLEALEGADINQAKVALANAATALLHGESAARDAEATAQSTFETGVGAGLPEFAVSPGTGILAATVQAGLAASNAEVRRHIKGGALHLNDTRIDTHTRTLEPADFEAGPAKLSVGKKRHALLRLED